MAIFHNSLHHADDEVKVLKNTRNLLNKTGLCIVCEPGKGHEKNSTQTIKLYGVNERDMPPAVIKRAALKAGFSKVDTYCYPQMLHKSVYKKFTIGKKAKYLNNGFIKFLAANYTLTIGKRKESIVILRTE